MESEPVRKLTTAVHVFTSVRHLSFAVAGGRGLWPARRCRRFGASVIRREGAAVSSGCTVAWRRATAFPAATLRPAIAAGHLRSTFATRPLPPRPPIAGRARSAGARSARSTRSARTSRQRQPIRPQGRSAAFAHPFAKPSRTLQPFDSALGIEFDDVFPVGWITGGDHEVPGAGRIPQLLAFGIGQRRGQRGEIPTLGRG